MLKGIQHASSAALSSEALRAKDARAAAANEQPDEFQDPDEAEVAEDTMGVPAPDGEEDNEPLDDGFGDSIFTSAAQVPATKKPRVHDTATAGSTTPSATPGTSSPTQVSRGGWTGLKGKIKGAGKNKSPASSLPTANQQTTLDKAADASQKMKDVFGAEKMWEGKVRSRQVDAMAKSTASLSSKLCSLPSDRCPDAIELSERLMAEVAEMESRHDAIANLRAEPRNNVDHMDKAAKDAMLTCDLSVLSSMLVKMAADLVKQMDTQDCMTISTLLILTY